MDFKQLEAFIQVVEQHSFSKAAEMIYLSQPSVSTYINTLEKELQTQLIFRSTKEVFPTKAGKLFYEYAKNILSLREKAVFTMNSLADSTSGQIEIMASSVPSQYILPKLLAEFHVHYPNISFNVLQSDSAQVIKDVAAQKCEFGLVGAKLEHNKCYYEHFSRDSLMIISSYTENMPKLTKETVTDLFKNNYFVMREQGSGTKIRYEAFFKEIGLTPEQLKISACFSNTQSVIHAVAYGLGLSVVSALAAEYYIEQKKITPVPTDWELPKRDFYFVYKKDYIISSIAELFIKYAHEKFAGKGNPPSSANIV